MCNSPYGTAAGAAGLREPMAAAKVNSQSLNDALRGLWTLKSGWSIYHISDYNGPLDSAKDCRGQLMGFMDGWDLAVLAVSGYVAVVVLVRLMTVERDRTLNRLRGELQMEIQKQKLAEKQRKKQELKAKESKVGKVA